MQTDFECELVTIVTCCHFAKPLRCRQLLRVGHRTFPFVVQNLLHYCSRLPQMTSAGYLYIIASGFLDRA
jgi:hypothetical protein